MSKWEHHWYLTSEKSKGGTNHTGGACLFRQKTSQSEGPEARIYVANSQTSKEAGQARTGLMRKHEEEMWSEIMELSKDMEFYYADWAMA